MKLSKKVAQDQLDNQKTKKIKKNNKNISKEKMMQILKLVMLLADLYKDLDRLDEVYLSKFDECQKQGAKQKLKHLNLRTKSKSNLKEELK
ncbi:unnamed protein product (macronuclear) [Paramecium tetraurelia]|uniref:Uncharacterized protein n=1 Tax=Paramecium tetraurelia TaxID=5888 RepID=A0E2Q9_PARTE|nr:uncharacterized protein GSPATT00022748001 [Paramecium tetraurelia]CAK89576.1 unnamed protein product [Paramecium tetraurelia]|eukprot:XP_001456973.1 hypothetical protein (macronuclear) [Paramecium tetraurelia strain d4-2]